MQTIQISQIQIQDRQRQEIAPQHIQKLKASILSKGLLHPIVLSSTNLLVAGECRLTAIKELHEELESFAHHGQPVPPGEVPFTYLADLSADDIAEAELEENIIRAELNYMDEAAARVKIHELRSRQNPQQTMVDTAKEIAAAKGTPFHTERTKLAQSILVHENRDNPKVKAAKNLVQAHKAVLDEMETSLRARQIKMAPVIGNAHTVIHGDCLRELRKFPDQKFDGIVTDPPYGIGADTMKNTSQHFYDDSPEEALRVCKFIISEGFRITKPKALLFMFCDIDHFLGLRTFAQQHGWVTWRTPLVFAKGNVGHSPWGRSGFVRTYETILFAVKGRRELMNPGGPDVIQLQVSNKNKAHGAEKPPGIWEHLLRRGFLQGQEVIDPCCGAGSIFEAGTKCSVKVTGIELVEDYYNKALIRSQGEPLSDEEEESLEEMLDV
jgi:site-specific DNA-methyltransferase (adenine-specific)